MAVFPSMADVQGCQETYSRCGCRLSGGHDAGDEPTAHECLCGGSWVGVEGAAGFEVRAWPERIISPDGVVIGEIGPDLFLETLIGAGPYAMQRGGIRYPGT